MFVALDILVNSSHFLFGSCGFDSSHSSRVTSVKPLRFASASSNAGEEDGNWLGNDVQRARVFLHSGRSWAVCCGRVMSVNVFFCNTDAFCDAVVSYVDGFCFFCSHVETLMINLSSQQRSGGRLYLNKSPRIATKKPRHCYSLTTYSTFILELQFGSCNLLCGQKLSGLDWNS